MRNRLILAFALVLAWAVAAVALGRDDGDGPRAVLEAPRAERPAADEPRAAAPDSPTVVSVRRAQGVPDSWAGRAASVRGVERVVRVRRGQVLLGRSVEADGRVADRVRSGYAIPLDTLVADPRAYGSTVPVDARRTVAGAGGSEAVLSRSAA